MTVLASGSKGNCTLVASSRTRLLVDVGLSCREIFKRLRAVEEGIEGIDAILVTHEHQDHVQGLSVTARKLGIPVYLTEPTHQAWMRSLTPRKRMSYAEWLAQQKALVASGKEPVSAGPEAEDAAQEAMEAIEDAPGSLAASEDLSAPEQFAAPEHLAVRGELAEVAAGEEEPEPATKAAKDPTRLPGVEYFSAGDDFSIGDISIRSFTVPHDAVDPVGFVFAIEGVRLAIATDLGYIPPNVHAQLKRCDVLMLESNHDVDMLRDGPYPWSVKQRVMSRVGHLSNDAAAEFLASSYDGHAAHIVLAHLSESNNMPELARVAAERALRERMGSATSQLHLAGQGSPLNAIVI